VQARDLIVADRADGSQRRLLRAMFDAAVSASLPETCVPPNLPDPPRGRTIIVGAGKAAAAMARAVEQHWRGPVEGVVVTRYGHRVDCRCVTVLEAAHPVPDAAGLAAVERILEAVSDLTAEDLVLCLISGGGSALLPALPPGVALDDEQMLARALLSSGAPIADINCVRRHVSRIKGGRLAAAAAPARIVTLAISDVPGDDIAAIASGPTVPDPTTRQDALAILRRHRIEAPANILAWLESEASETPKPGDLPVPDYRLIATPKLALEAAARVAREAGYTAVILGDAVQGEAREVGRMHAGLVHQVRCHDEPAAAPIVLLSGGETTVTVRGAGRGGRNVEFLIGLLMGLGDAPGVSALAADTDGIDGTEENAGATIDTTTWARAHSGLVDPEACLARNDAYGFFEKLGDLVVTGPTLTNVNDFRAIVIDPPAMPKETLPR